MLKAALSLCAIALLAAPSAHASSSEWFETQGGSVRLVTSGALDASGRIRGMLDISLKPGWKTYWRDPGDAGVPPQIDVSASANIADVVVDFPAPQHHDEDGNVWAGYDQPVALPLSFGVAKPGEPAMIDAAIFLGVCQSICIPVQTTLAVDPASDPNNPDDAALVDAAIAALPGSSRPDFGIKVLGGSPNEVLVEAVVPGDPASADFFLAASDGYSFGAPVRVQGEPDRFSVPVLDRPADKPTGSGLHFTLTGSDGAVSGLIPYP